MIKYTLYGHSRIISEDATPGVNDRCDLCRELLTTDQYCRASMDGWHIWLVRKASETIITNMPLAGTQDGQD